MRTPSAVLSAALLILVGTQACCLDMTMARYDPTQSSCTSEKLKLPLALKWEFVGSKFDNNPAAPIVVNGTVYFACGDRIYAVDLATGSLKWRYPSDQGLGGSVKATPAYYNGAIYFGAGDENLYCLDAQTGAFRWAYRVRGGIRCPPIVSDGVVYFGADDDSLYALPADTGDPPIWTKPFTTRDDIAIGIALGSGIIVTSSMDGNVYGVVAASGKLRWAPFRLLAAPTASSPVISESIAIMASGSAVYGLSVRSGQQRWQLTLDSEAAATPAVQGYDVYVPCRDKKIYAYSTTGRRPVVKWTEPADLGAIPMSSPVVAGDTMWVTGSRGIIAAFSVLDGTLKWRYAVAPSPVTSAGSLYCDAASSPTIAEGALLVLTDDGVLHCFTPQAPDSTPPMIFATSPRSGSLMSGAPPIKISGLLYDIGSGVDFSTASITLDGQPMEAKTDLPSSTISYQTEMGCAGKQATTLRDGLHNIVVSAKDYAGNTLTREWYIITDSTLPPPRRSTPTVQPGKKIRQPATRPTEGGPGVSPKPPMPVGPEMPPPPPPPPPPPAPGPGTAPRPY